MQVLSTAATSLQWLYRSAGESGVRGRWAVALGDGEPGSHRGPGGEIAGLFDRGLQDHALTWGR
jgi:hypothetical protein